MISVKIATGTTGPVPVEVVIHATDPNDGLPRYWGLTFDRSMPPKSYQGYVGADVNEQHSSGDTMTVLWNLTSGLHYLVFGVTQSGGSSYGTYAGTITVNGLSHNFSGLYYDPIKDVTISVTIDFNV